MTKHSLHHTALELHAHGITTIPVRADGTKAPAIKAWQQHKTTPADIDEWFNPDLNNGTPRYGAMGIVTGPPSGNLELTEIEGHYADKIPELQQIAEATGLGPLWEQLATSWVEVSPSGGIHWLYRVAGDPIPGNQKLAQAANRSTIAETRGAGGQVVAAPTPGTAHNTGRPWERVTGGPDTLATISHEQRRSFHDLIRSLDERQQPETTRTSPEPFTGLLGSLDTRPDQLGGITPGDDYEQKTSWAQILEPAGWTHAFTRGATTYWTRPGKQHGISATTGHADDRDRLYVFSSSTEFPTFEPITKFSAYAILNHNGDHSAAATKLKQDGYGESPTKARDRALYEQLHTTPPAGAPAAPVQAPAAAPAPAPAPVTVAAPPAEWGDAGLRGHQRIAARLATRIQGRFIFVSGIGWHRWDGTRWAPDHRNTHINADLTELLRTTWIEAFADKDLQTDVRSAMSANGTTGVLALTSVRPEVAVEQVDTDPWLLNTPTGTLDLHTLQLRPHNPADRITKITGVGYDPEATSPTWQHFLNTSLPSEAVRGFLQRYTGLALIGKVVEHVLVIAHGNMGRNGKGVFARSIERALATYAITASSDLMLASRYGDKSSAGELAAIMRLRGARWVAMSELNRGARMDEATMKSLTGGDTLTAKHMGQNPVEFEPSHSIFMAANDLPQVGADSTAAWARIRAVPWEISWEGREDRTLEDRIEAELPGVLAWMVEGLRDYQRRGLDAPPEVLRETETYRADNDPVSRFIDERCLINPAMTISRKTLLDAYTKWAKDNGEPALTGRQFASLLRSRHNLEEYKSKQMTWRGIGLAAELDNDDEPLPPDHY